MAVKLPTRDQLGPLPTIRSGSRGRITPHTPNLAVRTLGEVGQGVAGFGRGISQAGDAAWALHLHQQKKEEFETEQRFQEFDWNQRLAAGETARNVQPGEATALKDTVQQNYQKNAGEFFSTVPEHLKASYEAKLFERERTLVDSADAYGRKAQADFSVKAIGDTTQNVHLPRARTIPTEQLDTVVGDSDRLIDANPDLTPIQKDDLKRKARREIGLANLDALPPEQARAVISARTATADGLIRKFEGFREGAYWDVNAHRVGYGSDTVTRADGTIEKVTPQTRVSREDAERDLARRAREFAGTAEKQVGGAWATLPDNAKAGLTSVAYNYGSLPNSVAAAARTGDPASIASAVAALPANPDRRRQEADIIRGHPAALRALTDDDWARADGVVRTKTIRQSAERAEGFENLIIQAAAGKAALPDRASFESSIASLETNHKNALLTRYDAAAGDVVGQQNFINRLYAGEPGIAASDGAPVPTAVFNPYDKNEQRYADAAFAKLGGDHTALQTIVNKTGIVPKQAATALRGDINSTDPQRVAASLTVSSNMLAKNPNVFASVENKADFENNAVAYQHYVNDLGMSAQEAAQKIIKERSPEYQSSVKARIKTEDVDAKIKKELTVNDLRAQFDSSTLGWAFNPQIEFSPSGRTELYAQYAEQVKERYLETGDWSLAKKQAGETVKRVWGVTNINGSAGITGGGVVMQYPPERAPAYAGIENVSDKFAAHAIETIKAETGKDVSRSNLRIAPVPSVTARQYKGNEAPQYYLSWQDENGNVQMLSPGKAFVVDPKVLRQAQTAARQAGFERAVEGSIAAEPVRQSTMVGAP
jgi:GH24 family phage-related lysozyme (muramidase)